MADRFKGVPVPITVDEAYILLLALDALDHTYSEPQWALSDLRIKLLKALETLENKS